MKKFTAVLCAAAMTLGLSATAFANPSITTVAPEEVKVSAETAAIIPEGKKLAVQEAAPENYENKEVADVVTKLNDDTVKITTSEILETLKVDLTQEIKTTSDNVIDPTEYEPITKFADLVITDGMTVEYDINGEVKEVTATVTVEALKDVTDVENYVIMLIDPKTGEVYFIEITEEDLDPETGELTVTFPCLGAFTLMQKTDIPETETELAE